MFTRTLLLTTALVVITASNAAYAREKATKKVGAFAVTQVAPVKSAQSAANTIYTRDPNGNIEGITQGITVHSDQIQIPATAINSQPQNRVVNSGSHSRIPTSNGYINVNHGQNNINSRNNRANLTQIAGQFSGSNNTQNSMVYAQQGTGNTLNLRQLKTGAASGNNANFAKTVQMGESNNITVSQDSRQNDDRKYNSTYIEQMGRNHQANVRQELGVYSDSWFDANAVDIRQKTGEANVVDVVSKGLNNIKIYQGINEYNAPRYNASQVTAKIRAEGNNTVTASQIGGLSTLDIDVKGERNNIYASQNGYINNQYDEKPQKILLTGNDNYLNVSQTGNSNRANVDMAITGSSTMLKQYGENNRATALFRRGALDNALAGNGQELDIDQIGNGNEATIDQTSSSSNPRGAMPEFPNLKLNPKIAQDGNGHKATITEVNNTNELSNAIRVIQFKTAAEATINLTGYNNRSDIHQDGVLGVTGGKASTTAVGNGNTVIITQNKQDVGYTVADVFQEGNGNTATVIQTALAGTSTPTAHNLHWAVIDQRGNQNVAYIEQQGISNRTEIMQTGNNNVADVRSLNSSFNNVTVQQRGNDKFRMNITGSRNTVDVNQFGNTSLQEANDQPLLLKGSYNSLYINMENGASANGAALKMAGFDLLRYNSKPAAITFKSPTKAVLPASRDRGGR